jgi:hypothetical protein
MAGFAPDQVVLPRHRVGDRFVYKSCAVVGNSGVLLQSLYGNEIDSHEAVFRMNQAVVRGFEPHVGRRTTFFFQHDVDWRPGRMIKERMLKFIPGAFAFARDANLSISYHCDDALRRIRSHVEGVRQQLFGSKAAWFSSGEYLVWSTLAVCRHVSVFGFYTGPGVPYYYFQSPALYAQTVHACKTCELQARIWPSLAAAYPDRLRYRCRGCEKARLETKLNVSLVFPKALRDAVWQSLLPNTTAQGCGTRPWWEMRLPRGLQCEPGSRGEGECPWMMA